MDATVSTPVGESARRVAIHAMPWALFGALFMWTVRLTDFYHSIPAYGDILEVLWGITWYGDRFPSGSTWFYPQIFYPGGLHVAAFGYAPGMFILLIPLYKFGGAVFAYNSALVIAFVLAFAGMFRLGKELSGSVFTATLAGLLFTFWGFLWLRINGHLNILLASALLPWIPWAIERAYGARHRLRWFALAGAIWALAVTNALYFTWLGAFLVAGWVAGRHLGRQVMWRQALAGLAVCGSVALVLSAPTLVAFLRASAQVDVYSYDIQHVNHWAVSLNSVAIPFGYHPWLEPVFHLLYRGSPDESSLANLGLIASVLALIGTGRAWRERRWRPAVVLVAVGVLLALGLTLKWNGGPIQSQILQPLDNAIWRLGHLLKPSFFLAQQPFAPFDKAVPLPGLVLAAVLPFWESARVVSRFMLIASVGFFLLAAAGAATWRPVFVRGILAVLLLFEVFPGHAASVPFPPPSHPAFQWLKDNTAPGDAIVDLFAEQPDVLTLAIGGESLWATQYHGRATVAGASSVWPNYTAFLRNWLLAHPHPLKDSDLAPLLRGYGARYILLYMHGASERDILIEAKDNPALGPARCFDAPRGTSPWPYPICVLEILPSGTPHLNVTLMDGWSRPEDWGIWIEGTEAHARWVATSRDGQSLALNVFPLCVPGRQQTISVEVAGVLVASHTWNDCEPWSEEVAVPREAITPGWNELAIRTGYAARPADISGGQNRDGRFLSAGITLISLGDNKTQ